MDDFFWDWVESLTRSLEWEDRNRYARAMEFTGASRRQERLEQQKQVTFQIGDDHESETAAGDGFSRPCADEEHVPHEHGGISKQYSTNGEKCDYPDCNFNYRKDCPTCDGSGLKPGGS